VSVARRLATNSAALIAAQVGTRLASLVVVLLIGRLLGPDGLGLYAMAGAVAALALVAADAGIDTVTIRAMATGQPAAPYLGALLPLRLALVAIAAAGATAAALAFGYPPAAVALAAWVTLAGGLEMTAGALRAALRAAETMVSEAVLIVAGQLLRAVGISLALLAGFGLHGLGLGWTLASLGSLAVAGLAVAQRHGLPRPRLDPRLWAATARETAPVTAWLLLTQIGTRSDSIIIGLTWTASEAGRFHAAAGVLSGLSAAIIMIVAALYPPLVRANHDGDPRRLWALAEPVLAGGLALALVIAILAPLAIDPLLLLLLGDRFLEAGPALTILRWALPAIVITSVAGVVVRARGHDRPLAWIALAGALVSLTLNLLLIPTYGARGAAGSTVAAEVVMAGLGLAILRAWHLPLGRAVGGGLSLGLLAGGIGLAAALPLATVWWQAAAVGAAGAGLVLALAGGLALHSRRAAVPSSPGAEPARRGSAQSGRL
jgi:O-antigen/teichoic acid export membrane protein